MTFTYSQRDAVYQALLFLDRAQDSTEPLEAVRYPDGGWSLTIASDEGGEVVEFTEEQYRDLRAALDRIDRVNSDAALVSSRSKRELVR